MNEKTDSTINGIITGCFICAIVFLFTECATRPVIVATDESVVSSQISAARIEAINGELRDILSIYDGFLGTEIGRAVGGIGAALNALDRYDEFVQGLIYRIRELERATRNMDDEVSDPVQGSGNWTNPFLD